MSPDTPPPADVDRRVDPLVAAALQPLTAAEQRAPAEQLAVYTAVHRELQAALDAEIS